MTEGEMSAWIAAYIEFQSSPDHQQPGDCNHWSIDKFFDLSGEPDLCWQAILGVLCREPGQQVLGRLAAGPLEDLIEDHGEAFIGDIEKEASQNPAFKHLLGGVWESGTPEVWNRVLRARGDKSW